MSKDDIRFMESRNKIYRAFRDREEKLYKEFIENKVFEADPDKDKPKIMITFPYPYMNGSLHLGHAYSSCRLDVYARYKRLKGYNVLFPWAWHWTGEAVYGTVYRLRQGDRQVISRLIELDGVDPEALENLKDPVFFVKYFTEKNREIVKKFGLSIDWRREFHTTYLHPLYNKFVEWQIRTLYKKGYIVKGTYPVVWCPVDESPTGDHDRLEGEGVRPEEYVLIKFKYDGKYLVAGTLRPETLYGVTNLWINPKGRYVEAEINGERWIISYEAYEKLKHQLYKVGEYKYVDPKTLIGKFAEAPLVNRRIPILPGDFVDTDMVTGVVYSVPAHAPYDYVALRDLKQSKNISPSVKKLANSIKPISIIKVDKYGDYPAIEIVEKMGIGNQHDIEKLEEATQEIYSAEYHKGVMKDNAGPISGLPVKEAKEVIKSILEEEGYASSMYDLPEKVICRCSSKCIVKILPDQWFLKYSDVEWKEKAHNAVDNMAFYPQDLRQLFHHYIDWYHDWPCTRRTGLGTPFPLDKEWIVETLTDSTIYNSFYIVAKYYNNGEINHKHIKDSFFDFVFLGRGDLEEVAKENKISKDILQKIRDDFEYWYPVDLRGSGKDLIGNHLTFFIFHHVAIFPEDKWPKGISANGFMKLNGKPMSKSKGNYLSLEGGLKIVGSDALRLSLVSLVDGLDDPDWSVNWAYSILNRLNNLENMLNRLWSDADNVDNEFFDDLLLNRFRKIVKTVSEKIDNMEIADGAKALYFDLYEAVRQYLSSVRKPSIHVAEEVVPGYIIMMSMYTPFLAEDLWRKLLGKEGYASLSEYPEIKPFNELPIKIDNYLKEIVEDVMKIIRITRKENIKRIHVVTAPPDLWSLIKEIIKNFESFNVRDVMNFARKWDLSDKKYLGSLAKFLSREWYGRYTKFKDLLLTFDSEYEYNILSKYLNVYLRNVNVNAEIVVSVYPEFKIEKLPYPLYPALYVE